ncbi:flagellar assembly protein FliW [Ureibacillus thermosphaericus]|uniref:Flagellar assembly factor FliW n=1 Tax=Ureibacillus thermosphaericus TaxID=51173 RepID=A0A840PYJ0_URETH|nr:flagellar assembly protein FliW [Ureibacillus thermosphaericus]MBB5149722.1 flagellar assembly factor FliW [Ureibacillus thermosphaericus]NKZ32644.1 flagellar assembly protein FliW [Ureibacillus thermosphaericus]
MQIHTKFLGEVEIQEEEVITLTSGLLGLEEYTKYVLLPLDKDSPLAIFQSIEESQIGFVVAYPFAFRKDYAFDISEVDKKELQVEKEEDLIAYSIVTLKEPFEESTLNLLAPIVINSVKKCGKQIVLQDNQAYPLRFPIAELKGSVK